MTKSGTDPRAKVSFEANGETWVLHYTTNALVELEEATGVSVVEILENEAPSLKMIRAMIWAGLIEHHEGLTQKEAGSIIDGAGGIEAVLDLVNGAMSASLPGTEDEGDTSGKKKAAA